MQKSLPMTIFVLEDEPWYGAMLQHFLEKNPEYSVRLFQTGAALFQHLHLRPDVVTIDFSLPDTTGALVLERIRQQLPDTPVVVISGQDDVKTAISLLKSGAFDYIVKDEDTTERLWNTLLHIAQMQALQKEVATLRREVGRKYQLHEMVSGNSETFKKVLALIRKASEVNLNVTLTGETGTGKEMAARAIHYNSTRASSPFVAINVAAIPPDLLESELFGHEKGAFTGAVNRRLGKFEEASGGTLFLDEITELDIHLQAKLLRALQEREITRVGGNAVIPVDVRLIVASNKHLMDAVAANQFREDLYYRLLGLPIHLPPLRERGDDTLALAAFFADQYCTEHRLAPKKISAAAQKRLLAHPFPGNVRELRSVMELACVLSEGDLIEPEHLQLQTNPSGAAFLLEEKTLKAYERDIIQYFLDKYGHDVPLTAEKLDIGRSTLYRMLQNGEIK